MDNGDRGHSVTLQGQSMLRDNLEDHPDGGGSMTPWLAQGHRMLCDTLGTLHDTLGTTRTPDAL